MPKTRRQIAREVDEFLAKPRGGKPPAGSSDIQSSFRDMAQRLVNAENRFVDYAMEHGSLTRPQALAALKVFQKARVIKLDAVSGMFHVKHGQFLEPDVLRRAAGIED